MAWCIFDRFPMVRLPNQIRAVDAVQLADFGERVAFDQFAVFRPCQHGCHHPNASVGGTRGIGHFVPPLDYFAPKLRYEPDRNTPEPRFDLVKALAVVLFRFVGLRAELRAGAICPDDMSERISASLLRNLCFRQERRRDFRSFPVLLMDKRPASA